MILDYYNLKAKELFDNYQRLEQHKSGYKASKYPRKYGLYLRKKLYEKYNPMKTREEAEQMEVRLARKLQKKGYAVWWN